MRCLTCFRGMSNMIARSSLKNYANIPGPKSLPVVGTLWSYLPIVGDYKFNKLHDNGFRKMYRYGDIVKEDILPGIRIVWLFDPQDIQELFRNEGKYPLRQSHLALKHYRLKNKEMYNSGGLLPTNGSEWWRLRKVFQKGLSAPQDVRRYLPEVDQVLNEFVQLISTLPVGCDLLPYLSAVFLEMLGVVAFDCRLDALTAAKCGDTASTASQLIDAALKINSCILKTDNGPQLWRRFNTPMYRKLEAAHRFMDRVAMDLVTAKQTLLKDKIKGKDKASILEAYLRSNEVDMKDVVGMTADMLLAGMDTTTYSTGFALYHLARNPQAQEALYEESRGLLEESLTPVTEHVLSSAGYVKAVLKESLRLNPVSVGVGRLLHQDAVFSGYHVPRGTIVVTQNQVISRLEKHFSNGNAFVPERWIKNSGRFEPVNPYVCLPFGHGPRACIARRLAEQNMHALLLKVVRNYKLQWYGDGKLDCESLLINKPDGPLRLRFTPRSQAMD